jgi:tetratricopeptide (TPR) repeat protein
MRKRRPHLCVAEWRHDSMLGRQRVRRPWRRHKAAKFRACYSEGILSGWPPATGGTFGKPGCRLDLVAKSPTAWRVVLGLLLVLWARVGHARPATLGVGPALWSGPTISIETDTGEEIDLASVDAASVVAGPLLATKLEFDFPLLAQAAELRVALPPRAAVLESDRTVRCDGDRPPSLVSGTWTKQLGYGQNHFSLIYAQPFDHGRAVVVSSAGRSRLVRLRARLTDQQGHELAEPLVEAEAVGDVVAQIDVEGEAFRAGALAMIRVVSGGKPVSAPIADAVVAVDTSASSVKEFAQRIDQARRLARTIRGKLALVGFDQTVLQLFAGVSSELPEALFGSLARRGPLGATNLEVAFSTIEALVREHNLHRVILFTDGIATAGLRDRASLSSLVTRWVRFGVRRLDVVAPESGSDRTLLEALVTAGLPDRGRLASASGNLERDLAQPSVPDLPVSVPRAIVQSPWVLINPLSNDERWILARVPEGVPLSVRVGDLAPRIVSPQPAWQPLFARYFEQQGQFGLRSSHGNDDVLVLEGGILSLKQRRLEPIVRCSVSCLVSGRLPPESIQRIVRLNFGRFRGCAVQNHQSPIVPKGRVTVRFVIGLDGQVTSVLDVGSTVTDRGFVRCVMEAFTALQFPTPPEGPVTVIYPLVFREVEEKTQPSDASSHSYLDDVPKNYVPVALPNPEYPLWPRDVGTEAYEGAFRTVMQAVAEQRFDDAERAAQGLLERHPKGLLANLARGRVAEARGNLAEARRAYGSLLDHFAADARVHRVAAAWLSHLGDRDSRSLAIDALKTAIRLKEGRADSERELAWLLAQEGAYEAALDLLTAAFLHFGNSGPTLLNQEIAILASTLSTRHPERSSVVIAQLKRSGTPLASKPETIFSLQNESERGLALAIYANPNKGRFRGTPYSDWRYTSAFEVAAAERRTPYAVRVRDVGSQSAFADQTVGLGYVKILDYDGKGHLRIEFRPFVLQLQGSEVDLSSYS